MSRRFANRDRIMRLDPDRDFEQINRILATLEFPWDMEQALGFALYRTFAVPSIGELLAATGEFQGRPQKRYDDTGLILDAIGEHGFASRTGRAAIRRMNQMHRAYPIANADLRYVLSVFVVIPVRWMAEFGWRPFTGVEIAAGARYFQELGRHMGIADVPATYARFEQLMDDYERDHFAHSPGGRAVSDATLNLMATFPPNNRLPPRLARRIFLSVLDQSLLDAFGYRHPGRLERTAVRGALRMRGRFVRMLPPRRTPIRFRQRPTVRSYPTGYDVARLGSFPAGCPVHPLGPQPVVAAGPARRAAAR